MGANWAGPAAAWVVAASVALAGRADEPPSKVPDRPAAEVKAAAPTPAAAPADAEKARADAQRRLKALGEAPGKGEPAPAKGLRDALEERLRWLGAWDDAVKARREAEHPEPSPERLSADCRTDIEHVKTLLEQAAKDEAALLPPTFRAASASAVPTETTLAEMKEAIDEAQADLKEWAEKLERLKASPAHQAVSRVTTIRSERDKTHQRVATLAARRAEREAAVSSAKSTADRDLAAERLTNFLWETRVEDERLQGLEARITLEGKLAEVAEFQLRQANAHALLAKKTLDVMQARYRSAADRIEKALKQKAADEARRAAKANDPLERFRATRWAQLLRLEAQITQYKNAWGASPFPSLEEEKKEADAADTDFANIRKLLDDGRVSHLDALRLNNDFLRIGPARDRLLRRDLAAATNQVTVYENALSEVELALVSDSRDDHLEYEALLERLPASQHAEAKALSDELDARHAKLLAEKRDVLVKLASRAEQTHDQVVRRLKTLDDQYGFIRTHLILVRDREPLGLSTVWQAERELSRLGPALARLASEACERASWGRVSAEFAVGLAGVLGLPWPLRRLRRALDRHSREPLTD
jgi:potassium efflux system protein